MSAYLDMKPRELEEATAGLRKIITQAEGQVAFFRHCLEAAEATRQLAEMRMDAVQEAIAHRIVIVSFPPRVA